MCESRDKDSTNEGSGLFRNARAEVTLHSVNPHLHAECVGVEKKALYSEQDFFNNPPFTQRKALKIVLLVIAGNQAKILTFEKFWLFCFPSEF